MNITFEIDDLLPGADWQRLETWAILADMTPMEYVRACVQRGHLELRAEVSEDIHLRPSPDEVEIP